MNIKEHKPVALFKSVTYPIPKEKEKYFIVETVKHNMVKPFRNNNTNNNIKPNFTSNVVSNNLNNTPNSSKLENSNKSFKKETGSSSNKLSNNAKNTKTDEMTTKVLNEVNNVIEKSKLHFTEIKNNKITQEELLIPQTYPEQSMNIELNKIILNSIINLSKYINELFDKLINGNNDNQTLQTLLICLSSIKQKINVFNQIKLHSIKIDRNSFKNLLILKNHLQYIYNYFKDDLAQNLKEIFESCNNFCEYLNNNHIM